MAMSRKDLELEIMKILDLLIKNKSMPKLPAAELQKVVENVASALQAGYPKLTKEDLHKRLTDKDFRKTLFHSFAISVLNLRHPQAQQVDIKILFPENDKKNVNHEKLENELKLLFMQLYKLDPYTKHKGPAGVKEVEALAAKLALTIKNENKSFNDGEKPLHDTLGTFLSIISNQTLNTQIEFGGINTAMPGSIAIVVQAIPAKAPWVNTTPSALFGNSAVGQDAKFEGYDYSTAKRTSELNLLAYESIDGPFEKMLEDAGLIAKPVVHTAADAAKKEEKPASYLPNPFKTTLTKDH